MSREIEMIVTRDNPVTYRKKLYRKGELFFATEKDSKLLRAIKAAAVAPEQTPEPTPTPIAAVVPTPEPEPTHPVDILRDCSIAAYGAENVDQESFDKAKVAIDSTDIPAPIASAIDIPTPEPTPAPTRRVLRRSRSTGIGVTNE